MQAMAECSGPPQSTRKDVLGTFYPSPEPVDSSIPSSAPLSRRTLLRHSSFVRAVCVDAPVRICAGGDQRWSSLPRQQFAEPSHGPNRKRATSRIRHRRPCALVWFGVGPMRPERIPLFPLNVVLLPGAELPLHIFEPRYRQMVKDCLEEKSEFGMVLSLDKGVARVGCTAEIVQVAKRYPDGRMDILTIGRAPFRGVELFTADLLLEGP